MSDESAIRVAAEPAKAKPKGLGRGLGALLGETRREEPLATSGESGDNRVSSGNGSSLAMLGVSQIEPHPDQPRRHFDEDALGELAASIAQRGVIQPVIVRPLRNGRYQLVAGERRWRAAQKARIHEIPAIVRELAERDVMALALIENLQREDLNPIEEARAYVRIADIEGLTQAEIATLVDKSRSHVANLQRLLSLPDAVVSMVEKGALSMGHARALIGCERAIEIAEATIDKQLSVREVERLVRTGSADEKKPSRKAKVERPGGGDGEDADITAVQRHLEEFLGMPVRIQADADPRSGAVTIRYGTLDQLDLICQRLTGGEF